MQRRLSRDVQRAAQADRRPRSGSRGEHAAVFPQGTCGGAGGQNRGFPLLTGGGGHHPDLRRGRARFYGRVIVIVITNVTGIMVIIRWTT